MTDYSSHTVRRVATVSAKQLRLLEMIRRTNERGSGFQLRPEYREVYAQALSDLQFRLYVTWRVRGSWERAGYVVTELGIQAMEAAS